MNLLTAAILLETLFTIIFFGAIFVFGVCCNILSCFISWLYIVGFLSLLYWFLVTERTPSPQETRKRKDTFVVIVGAGYSGLCAAIRLKKERIRFVLIEKSETLGGTWWDNKYPGCACDIPSHFYSLSFKLNAFWTKMYSSGDEIQDYLEDTADYYGIREHVKFGCKVETCEFNRETQKWSVKTSTGQEFECNYLISGMGALHAPKFPSLKGMEEFQGEHFHTAQWKDDFDWSGKRVGIIGTGSSSIQAVPKLAERCEELYVFQRTPAWIFPLLNLRYPAIIQKLFQAFPFVMKLHRLYFFFRFEFVFAAFFGKVSIAREIISNLTNQLMSNEVADPKLAEKLIPKYSMFSKRITISNDYLKTFNRPNVHLITEPIQEITHDSILLKNNQDASAKEVELDAIIYATGFDVLQSSTNMDIKNPNNGKSLSTIWGETPNAYMGIMPAGIPNFFMLFGPGTVLGHSSAIFMTECQIDFMMKTITRSIDNNCASVEVTQEMNEGYKSYVTEELKKVVYGTSPECKGWYYNESGTNYTLWPASCLHYWWKTSQVNFEDFKTTKTCDKE
eukprot:TCONS_00036459-protein